MNNVWENLHPEVRQAAQAIADSGKFDDAIFAAFRIVEAEIQKRIGSSSIGQNLLDEAFDGPSPKIDISPDLRDRLAMKQLFVGALGNIRNDRGHKKAPLVPCKSYKECILYLSFSSLLIELLEKDRNSFPIISGVWVHGTPEAPYVELRVQNCGSDASVLNGNEALRLVRVESDRIEVALPSQFSGEIRIVVGKKESKSVFCDYKVLSKEIPNSYCVINIDVPLYSDELGQHRIADVVGVILSSNEGGFEFLRIIPTRPGRYSVGDYVTHGPFEKVVIGPAFYRPPGGSQVEVAWHGSLVYAPDIIGRSAGSVVGGISICPSPIQIQLGERRSLRALAWKSDGPSGRQVDISDDVSWLISNTSIAYVDKAVLIPKKLGKTEIECRYEGFLARAAVSVAHIPQRNSVVFFQGLRRLQQIRLDKDENLFVCNQSPNVYRIGQDGTFSIVRRLSVPDTTVHSISCLAIDHKNRIYVNDLSRNACHRFDWDGNKFCNAIELATGVSGSKQSIAINDREQVFIAVMGSIPHTGWVVRVDPDGSESIFATRDSAIYLTLDRSGNLYIPNTLRAAIDIYNGDGELLGELVHGDDAGVSDLAVGGTGEVYFTSQRSGRIGQLPGIGKMGSPRYLTGSYGSPGGIAMDHRGRIYVSDFLSDKIHLIY